MDIWSPFSRFGFLPPSIVGMLIIAALLAGTFGSSPAHAADGRPKFGLRPVLYDASNPVTKSYFVFDSRPGTILHNRVRVTNSGTATGTAILYAVDATTGQTSGTVYLSHNDVRRDVGAWITLRMQSITLAPGQSRIVPFQVTTPKIVRPGQHVGGIVAESMMPESASQSNSLQIQIQNLTILAVQVNLPGAQLEQLVATGIQPGGANNYQTLLVGLRNTGTMMLKPHGTLQVTDAQGSLLQTLPLKLDTFLPQTAIDYPVYLQKKALGVGSYRATLTLIYGHGHELHYTTVFTITGQQIAKVFQTSNPLLSPGLGLFGLLSSWQIVVDVLFGLLVLGSVLCWGRKLYRLSPVSHRGGKNSMGGRYSKRR